MSDRITPTSRVSHRRGCESSGGFDFLTRPLCCYSTTEFSGGFSGSTNITGRVVFCIRVDYVSHAHVVSRPFYLLGTHMPPAP